VRDEYYSSGSMTVTIRQHHTYSTTYHAMNHAVISSTCILILLLRPSLLHPAHLYRAARPVTGSKKVCDGVRARSRITANAALPQTKGGAPALSEERMHAATHPRQAVTDSRFSFIGLLTYVCGGLWSTRGSISGSLFHRPVFAWPFDR
jgi:hypothetical protein